MRKLWLVVAFAVAVPVIPARPVSAAAGNYDGRDECGGYSYDRGCRHESGDRDNRDDNRRAGISPGPFDRSPVDIHDNNLTVCFPFSQCKPGDGDGNQPQPPKER